MHTSFIPAYVMPFGDSSLPLPPPKAAQRQMTNRLNVLGKEGHFSGADSLQNLTQPGLSFPPSTGNGELVCVCVWGGGTADPTGKKFMKGSVPAFARTSGS